MRRGAALSPDGSRVAREVCAERADPVPGARYSRLAPIDRLELVDARPPHTVRWQVELAPACGGRALRFARDGATLWTGCGLVDAATGALRVAYADPIVAVADDDSLVLTLAPAGPREQGPMRVLQIVDPTTRGVGARVQASIRFEGTEAATWLAGARTFVFYAARRQLGTSGGLGAVGALDVDHARWLTRLAGTPVAATADGRTLVSASFGPDGHQLRTLSPNEWLARASP